MIRPSAMVLVIALVASAPVAAGANGDAGTGPPTVFERFVLSACSPCIRESFPIASLAVTAQTLPWLPRAAAGVATRPGEIGIEVLRARQPGRPDWRSLAVRVTLSVMTGPGGEVFRLGTGLLDGADARSLAQAVDAMVGVARAPQEDASVGTVDVDFHGGSLRLGVLRIRGDAVAYIQTGDLTTLLQRAVWEVPTTLYVPVADLSSVAAVLSQAAAKIEQLRGN